MVGHDLRCPVCSSFAKDVDHDLNLDNCSALQWTCEVGHVVMYEIGKETVVRQKVIGSEPKPVDPPKAEVEEAPVEAKRSHHKVEPPVMEKRSHHAKPAPIVHRKGGKR